MKRFSDLPVYFIIIGIIINMIMFLFNEVSFVQLMIRTIIIILLFSGVGYFLAYVLGEANTAIYHSAKQKKAIKTHKSTGTNIDIRVNSEEDAELFKLTKKSKDEEFTELNLNNFNKFMNKDSN